MSDRPTGSAPGVPILDLLRLTLVPGVGPKTCRTLIEEFGSAAQVLDARESELREVSGVGPKVAEKIARARREVDAEAELELCRQMGVEIVARGDEGYPPTLAEIPDPPSLLYVRGKIEPADQIAIALVGSRKCTPYGLRIAERLATSLARVGLTVVSGLARGIDAAAHRGALTGHGRTLAVLANGLGRNLPARTCGPGARRGRFGSLDQRVAHATGAAGGVVSAEKAPFDTVASD